MPSPKQSSNQDKPKLDTTWQNDPWNDRSEEFYALCYKGGSCRYCHQQINTKLDICNCSGMKAARARFKALINSTPAEPAPEPVFYNPNQFTEQEDVF